VRTRLRQGTLLPFSRTRKDASGRRCRDPASTRTDNDTLRGPSWFRGCPGGTTHRLATFGSGKFS
jgi:hypothetical protein